METNELNNNEQKSIFIEENYEVTEEKISEQIDEWVNVNLPNFKFRKFQKEAIINIINRIVNQKNHNIIIEAPTGSGKSLINIISSQVLWTYYKIDSYILCSDLYLFDQYEKFVEQNPQLEYLAAIKGQTGNYKCDVNKEDIRNADCQQSGISWNSLINKYPHVKAKGYHCCETCHYVKIREKAIKSPVTITTYQNYLYQLNIVYKLKQQEKESDFDPTFGPRKVIFCDEAHNIPSVIQLKYTPEIRFSDLNKIKKIVGYYNVIRNSPLWDHFRDVASNSDLGLIIEQIEHEFEDEAENYYDITDIEIIENRFRKYWNILTTPKPSLDDLSKTMLDYQDLLMRIKMVADVLVGWVRFNKKSRHQKLDESLVGMFKISNWLANYCCVLNDFNVAWNNENTGIKYVLKQILGEKEPKKSLQLDLFSKDEEIIEDYRTVSLNCMKEDYLVYIGLLSWTEYRVFISATIGGKGNFSDNNGIHFTEDEVASFDRVPSIFNFDKSPINFINRYRLTFKERNVTLPKLCKMVQKICNKHGGEKGIIQTGSYEITKTLIESLNKETKDRLLSYNGSKEKIKAAEIHKRSKNTILIGPSLNQGIDLPDDNVRFIIILKVPFPSLGDEYVKEKIRLFPKWYEAVTATEIIQGIGRGVRNENDWCETYILDACFYTLYLNTLEQFSDEMKDRIKFF